jgi:hypothetical protein
MMDVPDEIEGLYTQCRGKPSGEKYVGAKTGVGLEGTDGRAGPDISTGKHI